MINYSKYKEAGVLELEACLKATKILAKFNRRLEAADFLQNTIYIGIKLEPDREIERLSTLAELYGMIGFKRKEAFYKRVAAMYCVQAGLLRRLRIIVKFLQLQFGFEMDRNFATNTI